MSSEVHSTSPCPLDLQGLAVGVEGPHLVALGVGDEPGLLPEVGLGVHTVHRPHEVEEQVGVVDGVVEHVPAAGLDVAPGGAVRHQACAARGHVEEEPLPAEHLGVEYGLVEAVQRVAAVVLGDGQDDAALVGGLHHPHARPDGDAHGLLGSDVDAGLGGLHGYGVVLTRGGHDVHGVEAGLTGEEVVEAGVDVGALAEQPLGLACDVACGGLADVADGHVVEGAVGALGLGLSVEVAESHAAAPHLRYLDVGHVCPPSDPVLHRQGLELLSFFPPRGKIEMGALVLPNEQACPCPV